MRANRLKRWWEGVPVTILTDGVERVEGTNTISDEYGDADCVWDPGFKLEPMYGCLHCTIHRRDRRIFTLETGCRCGEYDVLKPDVIHHFVTRLDAMVEIAAKLGAPVIYVRDIQKLNEDLVEHLRNAGIQLVDPV